MPNTTPPPELAQNPLLDPALLIPFDRIEAEHVRPAIGWLLGRAGAAIDAIEATAGPRTYANTLAALEDATEQLEQSMTVVGHLEAVASTPALRDAYNAVQPEVSTFYAGIPLREGLWKALSELAASEEALALDPTRKRFLDKTLADFRRHGAELDAEGKARLQQLTRRLTELTSRFSQNVVDATASFELIIEDREKLAGLPESAIAAARQSAQARAEGSEREAWRFTLQAPSLIAVLTYLDDRAIREQLYRAYNSRATDAERDNPALIEEILTLRAERARLLGYADFSDLVLEDRMAKRG